MRRTLLGGCLLAVLLIAPAGGAHIGAMDAESGSDTDDGDAFCVPVCGVATTRAGNVPPATVVESGGTVTWTIAEGSFHTATSDRLPEDLVTTVVHNERTWADVCLDVGIVGPTDATFRIQEGVLQATPGDGTNPSWSTCSEAVSLEGGGFALAYHCNAHPRNQHGVIHVVPAT